MNAKHPYDIKNITPMVKSVDLVSDWWQANDIKHGRMETNEAAKIIIYKVFEMFNLPEPQIENSIWSSDNVYIY